MGRQFTPLGLPHAVVQPDVDTPLVLVGAAIGLTLETTLGDLGFTDPWTHAAPGIAIFNGDELIVPNMPIFGLTPAWTVADVILQVGYMMPRNGTGVVQLVGGAFSITAHGDEGLPSLRYVLSDDAMTGLGAPEFWSLLGFPGAGEIESSEAVFIIGYDADTSSEHVSIARSTDGVVQSLDRYLPKRALESAYYMQRWALPAAFKASAVAVAYSPRDFYQYTSVIAVSGGSATQFDSDLDTLTVSWQISGGDDMNTVVIPLTAGMTGDDLSAALSTATGGHLSITFGYGETVGAPSDRATVAVWSGDTAPSYIEMSWSDPTKAAVVGVGYVFHVEQFPGSGYPAVTAQGVIIAFGPNFGISLTNLVDHMGARIAALEARIATLEGA